MVINSKPNLLLYSLSAAIVAAGLATGPARASTFTTLYQFVGGSTGSDPVGGVVQDASGTLYGETYQGGTTGCKTASGNPKLGCGILYSFSRTAGLKALVTFDGLNGAYGLETPTLIGSTVYGSAVAGGGTDNGVLFSVHTDGSGFRLLHQFSGVDGSQPNGALVPGPGRVLYGVASFGGPKFPAPAYGVLFKIAVDGTFTVLHSFGNGTDGGEPNSIVVEKSGIIIGSTFQGGNKGAACGDNGCGVLYVYNPMSGKFAVLYTLTATNNTGAEPVLGSVAQNGTVYGNSGLFFELSPATGYLPLPATGGTSIGYGGNIAPVLSPTGSLTATYAQGPFSSSGTLYQQSGGVLTPLHIFDGFDGAGPDSTPLLTPAGSFIGTTSGGGAACSCGTIYEYTP